MKNELRNAFLLIIVLTGLLFATSCKKKQTEPEPINSTTSTTPTATSGELTINTMQHCPSYSDVYLANATVNLYLTKEDYSNNNIAKTFKTDDFGTSNHKGLIPQVFYYKVIGNINTGSCKRNGVTINGTLSIIAGINNIYTITLQ